MPDLFDNFFSKVGATMNGGKTKQPRYTGSSQVNSGSYYSYHGSATNNSYWMAPKKKEEELKEPTIEFADEDHFKPRKQSMASIFSGETSRSRFNSVSSEHE